ncbi:hypothetical protein ABMA28_016496, partial [Loxostege sticticalis]
PIQQTSPPRRCILHALHVDALARLKANKFHDLWLESFQGVVGGSALSCYCAGICCGLLDKAGRS